MSEPIHDLTALLKAAQVLMEQTAIVIRERPERLTLIDHFLDLKVMTDKCHSLAIEINCALSKAHNEWLSKHPTLRTMSLSGPPEPPPTLPTDPAERQALLNEIDSTP